MVTASKSKHIKPICRMAPGPRRGQIETFRCIDSKMANLRRQAGVKLSRLVENRRAGGTRRVESGGWNATALPLFPGIKQKNTRNNIDQI